MKTAVGFLCEEYEATPEDLQLHIALNPDVKRIERAMEKFRAQAESKTSHLFQLLNPEKEPPTEDGTYWSFSPRTCSINKVHFHDGKFWEHHNILPCFPEFWIKGLCDVAALRSQPEKQMPQGELFVWDGINSNLESVKDMKEAEEVIREICFDGKEIHPDAEALWVFKKVAEVTCKETGEFRPNEQGEQIPVVKFSVEPLSPSPQNNTVPTLDEDLKKILASSLP